MAKSKIAFIFPGQGAQYVGMGRDFFEAHATARATFEEAEEILGSRLTKVVFEGPESSLTETRNSQLGIYVTSVAILRVLEQQFPKLRPSMCAGLSLGEYSALYASGRVSFADCLKLVQHRANFMNEACEKHPGTMAVILGLTAEEVEDAVRQAGLPHDLWAANFNCPGQVVISGTRKGIEAGTAALLAKGAKRVLPLQVHGAFHSGLMLSAEKALSPYIAALELKESPISLIMNVVGHPVQEAEQIKVNLTRQVTHPVRWEQGVRSMASAGADLFLEIGCGKTLAGFNKRIGVLAPTLSVDKVAELEQVAQFV